MRNTTTLLVPTCWALSKGVTQQQQQQQLCTCRFQVPGWLGYTPLQRHFESVPLYWRLEKGYFNCSPWGMHNNFALVDSRFQRIKGLRHTVNVTLSQFPCTDQKRILQPSSAPHKPTSTSLWKAFQESFSKDLAIANKAAGNINTILSFLRLVHTNLYNTNQTNCSNMPFPYNTIFKFCFIKMSSFNDEDHMLTYLEQLVTNSTSPGTNFSNLTANEVMMQTSGP